LAETAEAGPFQTSWNARICSPELPALFAHYCAAPDSGFLDVFRVGAGHADAADLENYGSGDGAAFQKLSKECPAFAAEFAAVVLRCLRGHYGTINRYVAQLNPALEDLFQRVERLIDADLATFTAALSETPVLKQKDVPVSDETKGAAPVQPQVEAPVLVRARLGSSVQAQKASAPVAPPVGLPVLIPPEMFDQAAEMIEAAIVSAATARNPVLGALVKAVLDAGRQMVRGAEPAPSTGLRAVAMPAPAAGGAGPFPLTAIEAEVVGVLKNLLTKLLAMSPAS
jgi:hypothetical protein